MTALNAAKGYKSVAIPAIITGIFEFPTITADLIMNINLWINIFTAVMAW